jgi:hypothetical protein
MLVTIYVENSAYSGEKWVTTSYADKHGHVEQHLQEQLNAGWKVISLSSFGGVDGLAARGWIVALLEK